MMVPLNLDEHLRHRRFALQTPRRHWQISISEFFGDAYRSQASDRGFKVGCKKAFSPTGSAEDNTGQYLESPKRGKERFVVSSDWTASQNKFGSSAVLRVREHVSACWFDFNFLGGKRCQPFGVWLCRSRRATKWLQILLRIPCVVHLHSSKVSPT